MHGTLTMDAPDTTSTPTAEGSRDAERLGELFDRHHGDLHRLALRMLSDREEALDLVQEAFLRAARSPGRVPRDEDGARKWLVRIAVNLCRDRHRRRAVRRRFRESHRAEATPPERSPESTPEDEVVARRAVHDALAALDPRRRAVVVLHELEERSTAEVAELLGIAVVTVRWHLSRARRELAERLAPHLGKESSS